MQENQLNVLNNAYKLAILANASYLDKKSLDFTKYKTVKWFESSLTQAILLFDGKNIIISVAGTRSLKDSFWLNLAILSVRQPDNSKVHLGFALAADSIYTDIVEFIHNNKIKGIITCTGHSRGAAIATILAKRLNACYLYTFGSPKVATKSFYTSFTTQHYRFINTNDIITAMPFFFYSNNGIVFYFNYYGDIRRSTVLQRIKDFIRQNLRALAKKEQYSFTFDHGIKLYIIKINNARLQINNNLSVLQHRPRSLEL